jgi:hypothetical protein
MDNQVVLTETMGIGATIGFLAPILIAAIIQSDWSKGAQGVVALLICVVCAALGSFLTDNVQLNDPSWNWVTWFGSIWGVAVISYMAIWKPTNVAPTIEDKTNLKG